MQESQLSAKKRKRHVIIEFQSCPQADGLREPLSYLSARWREGMWPSVHFSQEAGQGEVTGRAWTRRQGVWVQTSGLPMGVLGGFRGEHKETKV